MYPPGTFIKFIYMWRHMYTYEMCVLVLLVLTHWDPHYVHIHVNVHVCIYICVHVYSIVTHYLLHTYM